MPGLTEARVQDSPEIEVSFREKPSVWLEKQYQSETLRFRSEYLDAGDRAGDSYTRYITSQTEETAGMLVATGDLDQER